MYQQTLLEPPQEIRLRKGKKAVEVLWADGLRTELTGLQLRKSCACSLCVKAQQLGQLKLIDADIAIDKLELSGVSGLQFHFSDGHYRGLFPWAYLRSLGEQPA